MGRLGRLIGWRGHYGRSGLTRGALRAQNSLAAVLPALRSGGTRNPIKSRKGPLCMTRALSTLILGGFVAALALYQPATAEAPKAAKTDQAPRTFAVLVGISQYADKQIKPRPKAEADVKALSD